MFKDSCFYRFDKRTNIRMVRFTLDHKLNPLPKTVGRGRQWLTNID